jgi:hypothetical protein
MIIRATFNAGVITVEKDGVEIPNVRVQYSKLLERPPAEVKLGKRENSIGEACADFTAVRWEFRCEVPTEMEGLVDGLLS